MRSAYSVPGSGEPGWREVPADASAETAELLQGRRNHFRALFAKPRPTLSPQRG